MPQLLRDIFGSIYSPIVIPAIRIGGILALGYVILRLIDSGLNRLRVIIPAADVGGVGRIEQRTETLRHIIRSVSKGILILVVALTVSYDLGLSISPVLASEEMVG